MSRTRALCVGLTIASLAVLPTAAQAATDIFFEGDGLHGEATAEHYAGQIDVLSFSWGASRARLASKATFNDVNLMKRFDSSSPTLLQDVATGKLLSSAKLHFVKAGGTTATEYLTYCFTGVQITSDQVSGSEEVPTESVSFSYQTLAEHYVAQDSAGSPLHFSFGWDLVRNLQLGGANNCG